MVRGGEARFRSAQRPSGSQRRYDLKSSSSQSVFFSIRSQLLLALFFSSPVRMLLQPKGSRSHACISNSGKRSFLTTSISADTLTLHSSPDLRSLRFHTCLLIVSRNYAFFHLYVIFDKKLPFLSFSPKSSSLSPSHSLLTQRQRHQKPEEESPSGMTQTGEVMHSLFSLFIWN